MATITIEPASAGRAESVTSTETPKYEARIFEDTVNSNSDSEAERGSVITEEDLAWTENTDVPRRRMGVVQVASLVINQMIDNSMLTLPGTVLAITGSKTWGVGLWVILGFYTFLSGFMFLEYSGAYPYTGGPLIWFDEIFHKPAMLAAMVFAWYWTLLSTTSAVSTNVAISLLSLASSSGNIDGYSDGFVRLTAVFVITAICLALYLARRFCFMLMSLFAVLKVGFMLAVFIAGMSTAVRRHSHGEGGLTDFTVKHPGDNGLAAMSGLIYVSFTYQGWEHTNYIAGEIRNPRKSLRKGVFSGIILVWIMYVLVTAAFYAALSYDEIVDTVSLENKSIGFLFANTSFGSATGIQVISAMASFSCALALTYTFAKVRQAIAWQRIFPFYKFIGRQDRQFDSPGGALLLHWIFTTLEISAVSTTGGAGSFWGLLYTYGYQIELGILALGMLWLTRRMKLQDDQWKFQNIRSKWFLYALVIILVGFNLLVVVAVAMDDTITIPNWWMAVVMGAIAVLAVVHWSLLKLMSLRTTVGTTWGQRLFGLEVKIHTCGDDDESELSDSLRALMREARADGTRRRIEYKLHGRLRMGWDKASEFTQLLGKWLE